MKSSSFARIDFMWLRIRPYFIITIVALTSTFILWLPFLFRFKTIGHLQIPEGLSLLDLYKHWDGALYVIVAKSWYSPESALLAQAPLGLSPSYFTAHFPLYPVLISLFSPILGYLKSMLVWPVIFGIAYACLLYYFVKRFKLSSRPLILAVISLFFSPRFFVIRSVPAPETLFMFLVLASVFLFMRQRVWLASLIAGLAVFTRSPGMLLLAGYGLFYLEKMFKQKRIDWSALWLVLIPLSLGLVFVFYYFQTGDFWAYFKSGDNIHLLFPPFQVFNQNATWVGTGWLEDVWYVYLFYLLALFSLWAIPKLRPVFYFVLVYFLAIVSVEHRDISRYSLPMLPFALVAFEKFFTSKKLVLALIILLPALYMYSWNFMLHNVAPITQWNLFQ